MTESADALVLGGGLGGSMVALELARAGRRAILFEKSKGPHDKVCGEFLSHESLLYLARHRVDIPALGGIPIHKVRLIGRGFAQESKLPFAAFSITRKRLDEELLRLALQAGVQVHRGAFVARLEARNGMWSAYLRPGQAFQSRNAFLATGKLDLKDFARPAGEHGDLVAFKMYYRLSEHQRLALGEAVELILFPGGYAGLQPVENGETNLCLLINSHRLRRIGSNWAGVMNHILQHSLHLADRLKGAAPVLDAPLAASNIPYGHLQHNTDDGLWRVGDQAAVIPSFSGDGMSIALHSGVLAATYFLQGLSAPEYQRTLHDQLARRLWIATRLSRLLVSLPQAARVVQLFPSLVTSAALMTRISAKSIMTMLEN